MGEDDIVELIWKSGQIVRSSQTHRPISDPPILRGSGSGGGGGGENAPLPPHHHENIFIHEDEMASWLHHPLREDYPRSDLLYSGVAASQPQSSVSLAPPPPTSQIVAARRAENFSNFARLRGNIITGAGPWIPVVRESTQVGSNATPSSSATESCLTPATQSQTTVIGGVSRTFPVPCLSRKAKEVAIETVCEIAGTSSSGVCKAEAEPIQIQPATETEIADDRKRKEREETEETKEEAGGGSTSRKRSRAAEMHNISERRRREKINEKMKALQELIPRCNKSDKASMLDDAIEYVKSLQMQLQMTPMGGGVMPMMYTPNMQQFMPHMAMGMMGMNRPPFIPFPGTPFPRQAHMAGLGPPYPAPRYPFPNIQAPDPSRIHLPPSQQPNPVLNQPQFPGYMNPYGQFVDLQQMQQPPPFHTQATTSQLSFSQASGSKEPEDQENQPTTG